MPRKYISQTIKKTVAANQQWRCNICKNMLEETFETDHIIPLMNGGSNEQSNLQSLCPNCHRKKSLHEKRVKSTTKKTATTTATATATTTATATATATTTATKSTATKSTAKKTNIQGNNDKMYQSLFGKPREEGTILRGPVGSTVDWSKLF